MDNKIPKIVHYCWFGKNEKPKYILECINTWKIILDDYTFKEWNEENFDISCNQYIQEAYESGKYAFVSDFVRAYALYNYGGIYMDTDVKVFKKFDALLNEDSFWGFEEKNYIATSTIGAKAGNKIVKELLDSYSNRSFIDKNGENDMLTNVVVVTNILKKYGYLMNGKQQEKESLGIILPQVYLSPYDYINCYSKRTKDTYAEHYYYKSWLPYSAKIKSFLKRNLCKAIGGDNVAALRNKLLK